VSRADGSDLRAELHALDQELRERKRREFDRDLPFQELVFDRWERARSLGFGEGSSVYHDACFFGDVDVGSNVWIGPWTMIDGSGGGVRIGDGCTIAAGVHIYTHDNVLATLSGGSLPFHTGGVTIGERTYVGAQAAILAGVSIGSMCVVGAHSLVTEPVPDRAVVLGSPARIRGRVEGVDDTVRVILDE
jgi:acetyltransferase-like isoleucine patch superfamily enzyme